MSDEHYDEERLLRLLGVADHWHEIGCPPKIPTSRAICAQTKLALQELIALREENRRLRTANQLYEQGQRLLLLNHKTKIKPR